MSNYEKFDDPNRVFNIKVPLEYSIDENYIQNVTKVLQEIASQKTVQDRNRQNCPFPNTRYSDDLVIELSNIVSWSGNAIAGTVTSYLIKDVRKELEKRVLLLDSPINGVFGLVVAKGSLDMVVELLNQNGVPVHYH